METLATSRCGRRRSAWVAQSTQCVAKGRAPNRASPIGSPLEHSPYVAVDALDGQLISRLATRFLPSGPRWPDLLRPAPLAKPDVQRASSSASASTHGPCRTPRLHIVHPKRTLRDGERKPLFRQHVNPKQKSDGPQGDPYERTRQARCYRKPLARSMVISNLLYFLHDA